MAPRSRRCEDGLVDQRGRREPAEKEPIMISTIATIILFVIIMAVMAVCALAGAVMDSDDPDLACEPMRI